MAKLARHAMPKPARRRTGEAGLDEALADTFPASDPPAHTNPSQSTRVDVETLREILGHRNAGKSASR